MSTSQQCEERLREGRAAQVAWATRPLRERLQLLTRFRRLLVAHREDWLDRLARPGRLRAESLVAEVLPLADGCRYLEQVAPRLLRATTESAAGRPSWCWGHRVVHRRLPWGVVLVIGPGNYPLFLPGIQALQSLAAGNAVIWKPGRAGLPVARLFQQVWIEAGGDARLLGLLSEDVADAETAIDQGVDLILLTGSTASGRAVLARAAAHATPALVELSGCDAVCVLDSADVRLAARAIAFGLNWNASATCVAPRRLFVTHKRRAEFEAALVAELATLPAKPVEARAMSLALELVAEALADGATRLTRHDDSFVTANLRGATAGLSSSANDWQQQPADATSVRPFVLTSGRVEMRLAQSDLFAPVALVIPVDADDAIPALDAICPYALGISVFGDQKPAQRLASQLRAGCIVINDLIAPTADPRLSFGGASASGFGPTRGPLGLLALTRPQAQLTQTLPFRPHLAHLAQPNEHQLAALLELEHGQGFMTRTLGLLDILRETFWKRR
jgi:acyl-CoA reductase-like NAD-dependent aldehyde dehydrogenase